MTVKSDAKLRAIFAFLERNRRWNRDMQMAHYRRAMCNADDPAARLKALLFNSVHAQQEAKLDLLCEFWRKLEARDWSGCPPTVTSLAAIVEESANTTKVGKHKVGAADSWQRLFWALRRLPGWGDKTAALFVKSAVNIHLSTETDLHVQSK
jgi:hypothetical protein